MLPSFATLIEAFAQTFTVLMFQKKMWSLTAEKLLVGHAE